ncbi:MAG: hypothetical protein QOF24_862 [Verrucomicrobiota bacterium]|jgi:hypothetical protein
MKTLAFMIALLIIAMGLTGLVCPDCLVRIGYYSFTAVGLYVVAGLRVGIGLVLFLAAPASRAPRTLRILGVLVCVGGVVTAFLTAERAHAILDWWSANGTTFVRFGAGVALALGSFIAYVTAPSRR